MKGDDAEGFRRQVPRIKKTVRRHLPLFQWSNPSLKDHLALFTQAEVQALRDACEELADDVRALSTLVHALRTALVNSGLIKGSA